MWQGLTARAAGTSHAARELACQDRESFRVVADADGGDAAIGVVCDGAGSAPFAEAGAELVCNALIALASTYVSSVGTTALTTEIARDWVREIRDRLVKQAEVAGAEPRDYASTLVFTIAGESATVCGQIGDGAIVVRAEAELAVPIWPSNGEYANETSFVSDADAPERLQIVRLGAIRDFVIFSDGLQRLALNEADRSAHAGFFEPLVATVRDSEALDATGVELETFLHSDRVNEKTDDDKSIVIACRIE